MPTRTHRRRGQRLSAGSGGPVSSRRPSSEEDGHPDFAQHHLARSVGHMAGRRLRDRRSRHVHPHHHDSLRAAGIQARRILAVAVREDSRQEADIRRDLGHWKHHLACVCGLWLALAPLITALALAITIIGIPLAYANLKLVPVALWPFGREILPVAEVSAAYEHLERPIPPPMTLPDQGDVRRSD
jgi:hypothetical protein